MSRKAPARAANLLIQYPAEGRNSSGSSHIQPAFSPPRPTLSLFQKITTYSFQTHPGPVLINYKKYATLEWTFCLWPARVRRWWGGRAQSGVCCHFTSIHFTQRTSVIARAHLAWISTPATGPAEIGRLAACTDASERRAGGDWV